MRGNFITEGSTSNAFIVDSNQQILTHPKNNYILGGVTRDTVIELARKNGMDVIEKPFSVSDIQKCNEAFLTSTTVGVIPVIKIDSLTINQMKKGRVTTFLTDKYNNYLSNQINE